MSVPVYYVAHPVAPPCACPPATHVAPFVECMAAISEGVPSPLDRMQVECNRLRALRWIRWRTERCDVALCAPWIPYVETLPDGGEWRERGLRDDCAMVARCDGIILVGGRISSGMARERDAAIVSHPVMAGALPMDALVVDLTPLGPEPPKERGALPACLRPR